MKNLIKYHCDALAAPVQSLVYWLWARAPAVGPWVAVRVLRTNTHITHHTLHITCQYLSQIPSLKCWSMVVTWATHSQSTLTHLGGCPEHPDMRHSGHWGGWGPDWAHHWGRGHWHGVTGAMGDHDPGAGHLRGQRGQELPLKYLYLILCWKELKLDRGSVRSSQGMV
mgnify:FL=1